MSEPIKTTVLPVVAAPVKAKAETLPKHVKTGDAFIVKLIGDDWLDERMAEIGLKPGMQAKGVLTDSPEGDEFHIVGYELSLRDGDPVVAGQVFAYDNADEHWRCEVIDRLGADEEYNEESAEEVQDEPDLVNHPPHYQGNGMEVIDVIEAFDIDRKSGHLQNVVKYALRAGDKGDLQTDVDKLVWYAQRLQARVRANDGKW